jgi:pyruvate,water dikinase
MFCFQHNTPLICDLSEVDKEALALVGGKGANLGELMRLGVDVPDGFCLTTAAYWRLLAGADAQHLEHLFDALDSLDPAQTEQVRRWGKEMRDYLLQLPIPEEVEQAAIVAWERCGGEWAYAVRSSATAEDLPGASFAGQQDTYLNVRGYKDLLANIHRCWASLFTDRAIVYRLQNGFAHKQVALAVVVQRMVSPDISGIMFTADPLSENRHILSIDAGYGLGEALVSGKISADLYRVDRRSGKVIETRIGDKMLAIRPLPQGGITEEALPDELRHAPVLQAAQIDALLQIAERIEQHYGTPQDIEWCIEGERLLIVQSRPITSLYPLVDDLPSDGTLHTYICFNHVQVMTEPISPMGQSILTLLLPFGKKPQEVRSRMPLVTQAGGRMFIDITEMLRHKLTRKIFPHFLTMADMLISRSVESIGQDPRITDEARTAPRFSLFGVFRRWLFPLFSRVLGYLFWRRTAPIIDQRTAFLDGVIGDLQRDIDPMQGKERLRYLYQRAGTIFEPVLAKPMMPLIASSVLSLRLTARLCRKPLQDPDIAALTRGLYGNVTTEMDLQLADVADIARPYPELSRLLRTNPSLGVLKEIGSLEGGEEFLAAFAQFLERFGMRGVGEIDIARQRWRDDPSALLQMIAGNLASEVVAQHRSHFQAIAAAGIAARDKLITEAGGGIWGWLRKALVRRLSQVHRDLMGVREHPKFFLIRLMGIIRTVLEQEAKLLQQEGIIADLGDIFYLRIDELLAWEEDNWRDFHALQTPEQVIATRKMSYEHWQKLYPPRVITSEGEIIRATYTHTQAPEGSLLGTAVSAGVVEGIARVIMSPADAALRHGEILVAPFTDPGWTPIFVNAVGLVMEVGGMMTHGSVVAREYGIPAVVCVPDATTRIQTGQKIRVNGDLGYVEILEPSSICNSENSKT